MIWLRSRSTDLVVRLLGGDPHAQCEPISEAHCSTRAAEARRAQFTAGG